jgi:TetR/AcrR family transcriptional regulator, transcriptional repressor of bet genes
MPKLGMPEVRRPQLIESTLATIDEVGLQAATVAMISKRAGVSVGIISHYFGGKYGLLEATMRSILKQLADDTRQRLSEVGKDDIHGRIKAIVGGNFDSHQIDQKIVKTWLAFWAQAMHEPALQRLQRINEKRLLSHLKYELKRILPAQQAELVAEGIAALIDGVWLRGALSKDGINSELAQKIIGDYLAAHLP